MKRNLNKERKVLAQLYNNEADTVKYLPFFFNDMESLKNFIYVFGGKTIKVPTNIKEFVENYFKSDYLRSIENKGVKDINKMKTKILESYINLFDSLEAVIENECSKDSEVNK